MKLTIRLTILALAGTLLLWGAYLLIVLCVFPQDWQSSGQFGDTFGALNTLFTGCAFVVVLATLIQQSKQIEATKNELKEERELQRQTTELVGQQAKALTTVARLNALTSRIEAYHVQIQDCKERGAVEHTSRMLKERHQLLLKLDEVLRSYGD